MNVDSFPEFVREALCQHHALRSLGFTADELFFTIVGPEASASRVVATTLRSQGREMSLKAGETRLSDVESQRLWGIAVAALNAREFAVDDIERMQACSVIYSKLPQLVVHVLACGFKLPCNAHLDAKASA